MTWLLVLGAAWLVAAGVAAIVIGCSIRAADRRADEAVLFLPSADVDATSVQAARAWSGSRRRSHVRHGLSPSVRQPFPRGARFH